MTLNALRLKSYRGSVVPQLRFQCFILPMLLSMVAPCGNLEILIRNALHLRPDSFRGHTLLSPWRSVSLYSLHARDSRRGKHPNLKSPPPLPITTNSLAYHATRIQKKSNAHTKNSPGSTTLTRTLMTAPGSGTRTLTKPTRCCPTRRRGSSTTSWANSLSKARHQRADPIAGVSTKLDRTARMYSPPLGRPPPGLSPFYRPLQFGFRWIQPIREFIRWRRWRWAVFLHQPWERQTTAATRPTTAAEIPTTTTTSHNLPRFPDIHSPEP